MQEKLMPETALSIRHLNVSYEQTPVLADVCFDVQKGEFLGIIGPNGGGKTTLLKTILGLIPADSGEISIFGRERSECNVPLGYVPQFSSLDRSFPISVSEVVLAGMTGSGIHPLYRYTKEQRELADKKLDGVGLLQYGKRQISELSGGEFQRLLVARATACNPKILFLDEPTASVDPGSKEHIYDLLGELNSEMTIVLVTHDLLAVSSRVTKIACLNRTLVYHGEPELDGDVTSTLYGCPVDLIAHGAPHRVLHEHKEGE